jgi:beta-lactamase superfamily II metal-dependent hydrolase
MSDLVIRAYNVFFGDAILVSIPDRGADGVERTRHILIDVGNLLANDHAVFTPVVADIAKHTGGEVDLYVMTHEHLDHVHGLLAAKNAGVDLKAKTAWLTASAATDYYDTHPDARRQKLTNERLMLDLFAQHDAASDPWLTMMIQNNNALLPQAAFGLRTADYVDHLRSVAPPEHTHYVHRGTDVAGKHPFDEAQLRILAPEENTADYYGRRRKNFTLTATSGDAASAAPPSASATAAPAPPVGVDAGAFYDLVASRNDLNRLSILEIDAAANNTSIVFEITWRGWKLLFPGDAEERSWHTMLDKRLLEPVHFVKVAHHGSINGTVATVLDTVLPAVSTDGRPRRALVSTHSDDWQSVPDEHTLDLYRHRQDCTLVDTRDVKDGAAVEIRFSADA